MKTKTGDSKTNLFRIETLSLKILKTDLTVTVISCDLNGYFFVEVEVFFKVKKKMIGLLSYAHLSLKPKILWSTAKKCTETRAACAARVFFFFLPIIFLLCDVVFAVAVG